MASVVPTHPTRISKHSFLAFKHLEYSASREVRKSRKHWFCENLSFNQPLNNLNCFSYLDNRKMVDIYWDSSGWTKLQVRKVEQPAFDNFILILIIVNSFLLAGEDQRDPQYVHFSIWKLWSDELFFYESMYFVYSLQLVSFRVEVQLGPLWSELCGSFVLRNYNRWSITGSRVAIL